VAWEKHKGIRTRPSGNWRQVSPLFEIAGLFYRRTDAKRFLAALQSPQPYSESFLPLVARRDPTNRHDANAIAIDGQWQRRSRLWPFKRDRITERAHLGFVPAEIAAELASAPGSELAIDFYDYSTDHRGEMAIRCLVLLPSVAKKRTAAR